MAFIAVLDACVLYSAPLRDLFMRLAVTDIFFRAMVATNPYRVVKNHRTVLKNPPKTIAEYLDVLGASGLIVSAEILRGFAETL